MMKFQIFYCREHNNSVVGLGFTDSDMRRMVATGKAVRFDSELLKAPAPGFDLYIYAAMGESNVKERAVKVLKEVVPHDELRRAAKERIALGCLKFADSFYVLPYKMASGRKLQIIGLDEHSFGLMRRRAMPAFGLGQNFETGTIRVQMFWGEDEFEMENDMRALGLLPDDARVELL